MTQFQCLDPQERIYGHFLLEASAGTGKTFTIEHLVLRMVLVEEVALEKILLVTFTKAATRELRRRIQSAFERVLFALEKKQKAPFPYLEGLQPQELKERSQLALNIMEQASIFTIHGFCFFLLSQFALECNFALQKKDPTTELQQEKILQKVVDFTKTQLKAPLIYPSQLQVLFGTKYKKDIEALVRGIYRLASSQKHFPETFSFSSVLEEFSSAFFGSKMPNSFVEEVDRIRPLFREIAKTEVIDSLRKQAALMDLWKEKKRILPEEFDQWIYEQRKKQGGILESFSVEKMKSGKKFPHHSFEQYESFVPKIKQLVDAERLLYHVASAARMYLASYLEQEDFITPDHLLLLLCRSLENKEFIQKVGKLYEALIIDEFQDTDSLQWEIFKQLFLAKKEPISYCYLVGDPKQSIYGFRGADLNVYRNASAFLGEQALRKLRVNYRSDEEMVLGLNALFLDSEILSHLASSGLKDSFPYYEVSAAIQKNWNCDGKKAIHIPVFDPQEFENLEEEGVLPFLAKEILDLHNNHGVAFSDIAVLVRDRFQSSRVHLELSKYQIPHQAHLQKPLYETEVFSFLELYFQVLEDPLNRNAMLTMLLHPILGNSYESICSEQKEHLLQIEMLAIKEQWSEGKNSIVMDALLHLQLGKVQLKELFAKPENKQKRQDFIQILEFLLEGISLKAIKKLNPDFEERVLQKTVSQPGSVQVLTIHKSKGLEYPFVFCIGINQRFKKAKKYIDFKMQIFAKEEIQGKAALQELQAEKLRLLYVGVTRAKNRLYIPLFLMDSTTSLEEQSALETLLPCSLLQKKQLLERLIKHEGISSEKPSFPIKLEAIAPLEEKQVVENRRLSVEWDSEKMLSFTQLASKETAHLLPKEVESEIPAGTSTGILLHDLIENSLNHNFHRHLSEEELQEYIGKKLHSTPLKHNVAAVTSMLHSLWNFRFQTQSSGLKLSQIDQSQLFTEADFTMHYQKQWLKGFIDLIAVHENQVFLFDWKTNLLPNYEKATLEEAMQMHQYTLQADLYAKALELYLEQFQNRLEFGGVFYVFLRGLLEEKPKGVYHYYPEWNRNFRV